MALFANVELNNTFDEWRVRTNDVLVYINDFANTSIGVSEARVYDLFTNTLSFTSNTNLVLPKGTDAQRGTASLGSFRYSTTSNQYEFYTDEGWVELPRGTNVLNTGVGLTGGGTLDSDVINININDYVSNTYVTSTFASNTYVTSTFASNTYVNSTFLSESDRNWTQYNTNTTLSAYEKVLADTSGSSITLTLPTGINTGTENWFADAKSSWGTNNLIINGNGNNILGTSTFTADVTDQPFSLVYNGIQWVLGNI